MTNTPSKLKILTAKRFLSSLDVNSFDENGEKISLYLFLSRAEEWESEPDIFVDSLNKINSIKREIFSLKKISNSNVSYVIPRIQWGENTAYEIYDSYEEIENKNFYVVNSNNEVFKCLHNGKKSNLDTPNLTGLNVDGNEPEKSQINPNNLVYTPDGYIWKYIYTIAENSDFNTSSFIPVEVDADIKSFNLEFPNRIESIKYIHNKNDEVSVSNQFNSGIYYTEVKGDGTGCIVEIVVENIGSFKTISNVNIINSGSGYTFGFIDINDVYSDLNLTNKVDFYPNTTELNYQPTEYIKPIISPEYGHGYDPISELYSNKIMFSETLASEVLDGAVPVKSKFSRYGLIKSPRDFNLDILNGEGYYVGDSVILETVIDVPSGTLIQQNHDFDGDLSSNGSEITLGVVVSSEVVNINGLNRTLLKYYKVVDRLSIDNKIVYNTVDLSNELPLYIGSLNNAYTVLNYSGKIKGIDYISGIGIKKYDVKTGEIVKVENINSINRAVDQTEIIKFVLEF